MIKIGNCYFNEAQIAAIQPSDIGLHADVYLVQGAVISVDVDVSELSTLLEGAGLLPHNGVEVLVFAPGENQALWLAYEDGYLFAAKDMNGQVFAYKYRPEKDSFQWTFDGAPGEQALRLHGDFECLSFEDEEPLDLVALFSESTTEEEDDD